MSYELLRDCDNLQLAIKIFSIKKTQLGNNISKLGVNY